jgi:Raf kinase inhibitor-like YbhB/YbcL family protein
MELFSQMIDDGEPLPARGAFCAKGDAEPGNVNPDFTWDDLPEDTESLVLICHDPDVPSEGDTVNVEGETVPADLPRVDFYHWVLVDLDPDGEIEAGEFSEGQTPGGKPGPDAPQGTRQGINDYTNWFAGDPDMEGQYFGYDGPCPPWNDSIVHHYHYTLYALDVDEAPVGGTFTGDDVLDAIEDHILDSARLTATYSMNPDVEA